MSSCSICCLWRRSPSSKEAAIAPGSDLPVELTSHQEPLVIGVNNNKDANVAVKHKEEEEEEKLMDAALERDGECAPLEAPEAPLTLKLSAFEQQMLDAHNAYRLHHSAPALAPCPVLAKRAQYWANALAAGNRMYHENQSWDGENIAMKYNSARQNFPGTDFVNMWYYEGLHYRFPGTQLGSQNKGRVYVTGHFTQVVWKHSKRVGFGRAVSKLGRVYVVARYRPPGNFLRWYNVNVLPPIDGKLRARYQPVAN